MQDFIPKKIDINGNIGTVTVKQFDNDSRFLHVTIIDGDLSDGDSNAFIMQDCSAALYMQPEGNGDPARVSYINGEIADPETGVVTFLIPGSVTRTPGRYECEIFIYQGNESERPVISTKPFSLVVEKSIRNDAAVMASQSFSALDAKMITVQAMQSQMNGLVASPAGSGGDTGTELRDIRTGWDGSSFNSAGEAVRTQAERSVKGIDTLLDTTGWGNFSSNFNSLPNNCVIPCSVNNSGGSISNAPYEGVLNGLIATFGGDAGRGDCDVQLFIPEDGGAVWYRQFNTRNGVQSWGAWATLYENVPQYRKGINALYSTYNSHAYEYTKEGTFYAGASNWNDLPNTASDFIISNFRYGENWVLQTAVQVGSPCSVFNRLVPKTGTAGDYSWKQIGGLNPARYADTAIIDTEQVKFNVGLPVLYLTGDTTGMSESNSVTLSYRYGSAAGSCSVHWQGSSSLAFSKKNYTITFGDWTETVNSETVTHHGVVLSDDWGEQNQYCLKANYTDNSNALNVCGAKLWSQIVADRGTHPAIAHNAPNNGAMDGFPCVIMLNGEFHGLYTWNIPKDKWAFGMGSSANEYAVSAIDHSEATKFRDGALFGNIAGEKDFKVEYAYDAASKEAAKSSLNAMLNTVKGLHASGWETAANSCIDVNTAIDYMIFSALIANTDGVDKNFILTSYDGSKWWFNAYDLDSILGNYWTGGKYYAPCGDNDNKTSFSWLASTSKLFGLIWTHSRSALISRYNELRSGILSEENMYMTFYNFCVKIPQAIIDEDNRKYPLKPGTSTETLSRMMEWYRLRCKFIDAEIQSASAT
ncbi:MAG: CotH kinase family protein [Clostridia bacterium]|nr:CotH kinase family protein [Clostridia bacterium]